MYCADVDGAVVVVFYITVLYRILQLSAMLNRNKRKYVYGIATLRYRTLRNTYVDPDLFRQCTNRTITTKTMGLV